MDETDPLGVVELAVAEAAHRLGARAVSLVRLGDEAVPVPMSVVGAGALPSRATPDVVTRAAVAPTDLAALTDALTRVPADRLPVVTTAWALSRLPPADRLRLLQHLDAAATHRAVAWVSVEGVGVAPAVPTLGDRPASGHSLIGLTVLRHRSLQVEVLGRCWSRGRWVSWLANA